MNIDGGLKGIFVSKWVRRKERKPVWMINRTVNRFRIRRRVSGSTSHLPDPWFEEDDDMVLLIHRVEYSVHEIIRPVNVNVKEVKKRLIRYIHCDGVRGDGEGRISLSGE